MVNRKPIPARELSDSEREALRRKKLMEDLIEHPSYKELLLIGEGQVKNFLAQLLVPLETRDATLVQEYRKGAVYGIRLLLSTPSQIIADGKDLARHMETERNGQSTRDSADDDTGDLFGPDTRVTADDN